MRTQYEHSGVVWIDLERPTNEEVEALVEELGLSQFIERELLTPTRKPRVDLFPNYIYAVLHFPSSRDTRGKLETHEVDLIITSTTVLTVHYESIPALLDFARSFEASLLLRRKSATLHSGHLLFELATRLYQAVDYELDAIEESVSTVEKSIFEERARMLVRPISELTREVINHKRVVSNQDDVLREFEKAAASLFGDSYHGFASSLTSLQYRVSARAQMLLDTLAELRDTNNSLLTTRQNEIMKVLTIMAFVTFPLTLISSLFGMNTAYLPLVGTPGDFWIIVSGMLALATTFFAYFKFKKWF